MYYAQREMSHLVHKLKYFKAIQSALSNSPIEATPPPRIMQNNNQQQLATAVYETNFELVETLVEAGADVTDPTLYPTPEGARSIVGMAVRQALFSPAAGQAWNMVEYLEQLGGVVSPQSVDIEDFLRMATSKPKLQYLIGKGFDINAQNAKGVTALIQTVAEGMFDADIDRHAIRELMYTLVDLFDLGADINLQADSGLDAIMIASGVDIGVVFENRNLLQHECMPNGVIMDLLIQNMAKHQASYDFSNSVLVEGDDDMADRYTLMGMMECNLVENNQAVNELYSQRMAG